MANTNSKQATAQHTKRKFDYEELYWEVLRQDPGLASVVEAARTVVPAQEGEVEFLLSHLDAAAKQRLFDLHLKTVIRISLKEAGKHNLEVADAIQFGSIGLMTAIERYDVSAGKPFFNVISWYIFQAITREDIYRNCFVVPFRFNEKVYAMRKSAEAHVCEKCLGLNPYCENLVSELEREYELPRKDILFCMPFLQEPISFETLLSKDPAGSFCADAAEWMENSTEEEVRRRLLNSSLWEVLDTLKETEKTMLIIRYGLNGSECKTLEECAKYLGLPTREQAKCLEARALRRLRHPSRAKKLIFYRDAL